MKFPGKAIPQMMITQQIARFSSYSIHQTNNIAFVKKLNKSGSI